MIVIANDGNDDWRLIVMIALSIITGKCVIIIIDCDGW